MGVFENDADDIVEALGGWSPAPLITESQYEAALYRYLNERFPREKFEKQYAKGKTRADVYVSFNGGATVAVELKKNLSDRGEYHRLVGQAYEYVSEWGCEVVIVLCGQNDPALIKNVRAFAAFMSDKSGKKVRFVEKAVAPARNAATGSSQSRTPTLSR